MTNVLMISFDDMNDWSSVLGGYAGTVHTPNLERLAAISATFTNAYAPTPVCNPSRSAVLTGMSPLSLGIFGNDQLLFDVVDPSMTLPGQLHDAGFTTVTSGKVFHDLPQPVAAQIYDDVLLQQGIGSFGDRDPSKIAYTMTTLEAGVFTGDEAELYDVANATAVASYLAEYAPPADGSDLFLSVGFSRPHQPWVVPQRYFDLYPLEDIIVTGTGFDDFADIPGFADFFATRDQYDAVVAAGELPLFIQAYLASVSYADDILGRVLDALEASAIADDTVVVLWSDHGFHPGEKASIGKFTLWEQAARGNLMIHDPRAPESFGERFDAPVSLQDLYPTLLDYAGVARPEWAEGDSLRTLIETGADPNLRGYAVTSILGSHSIRTDTWRYTRYEDGSEELYNEVRDPKEYVNLAAEPRSVPVLTALRAQLAEYIETTTAVQNFDAATPARLVGEAGGRVLVAGTAADTLAGGDGDDLYLVRAATVIVEERAGGGEDTVFARSSFRLPAHVENLTFAGQTAPEGTPLLAGNTLNNRIEIKGQAGIAEGNNGDDTLLGSEEGDTLNGNAGADSIDGGDGADTLDGGIGDDILRGGRDNDVFLASGGDDRINEPPDSGIDIIDLAAFGGFANTRIEVLANSSGRISALVLTQLDGTARLTADAVGGVLTVEALRDGATTRLLTGAELTGGAAAETLTGSAEADTLHGADGDDALDGGAGGDRLFGDAGQDTLSGAGGADRLAGGAGADVLFGGQGNDRFMFSLADLGDVDRIADFRRGDVIDLTAIDADPDTAGRARLDFASDIAVSSAAGQTRVEIAIGDTGDTLSVVLDGRIALTAQNFLL